jgi:predicted phosphodiesterase
LEHYLREGFTYIELGDAEELWENDAFEQIYITHTSIYDLLHCFHDPDPAKTRYLKVLGNHDEDWRDNPAPLLALFPGIQVHEAIVLAQINGDIIGNCEAIDIVSPFIQSSGSQSEVSVPIFPILLLHGHQVDPICSGSRARISRFLVRKFWTVLQQIGIVDPTRAAENPGRSNKIDQALYQMAKGKIVIAGHTHRPVFANLSLTERRFLETGIGTRGVRRKEKADPVYYNTGSCVHPRCITGIEITVAPPKDDGPIRPHFTLVKWGYLAGDEVCTAEGCRTYPLAITRTILETG